MKPYPKLQDVAEKAGVSIATASMVLSGKGKISDGVTKSVIEAAKSLGYSKQTRQTPTSNRNKYIAILHYESFEYLWNFMRPCVFILEEIFIQHGLFPVIFDMNKNVEVDEVFRRVCASNARAALSIHYGNGKLFKKLEESGIPVMIINNSNYQDTFSSVCVDHFQGAYEGALHLIRLGHKKISFIDYYRPTRPAAVSDRFIGFKKAIDEHGITFTDEQRLTLNIDNETEMQSRLRELFAQKEKPTAMFFHDDYAAAVIYAQLNQIGVHAPGDVSLLAPGDVLDYKQSFLPQITTMRIDTKLMARIAGELMLNRLKTKPEDIQVVKVKQQLIERGSCRKIQ